MTSREEITKIRRELQETERLLSLAEQKKTANRNFDPVQLPSKETHYNERTSSNDIDYVVHLPKKRKQLHENKW
tara:strand:- start:161 stop:382 length:222 start_codon:yes stop_codon:yes gene_type:complete